MVDNQTLLKIYKRARKMLDEEGWWQKAYGDLQAETGPHCAAGAIRAAAYLQGERFHDDYAIAGFVRTNEFQMQHHLAHVPGMAVTRWNDTLSRRGEEVLEAFDRTIAYYESRV